MKCLMKYQWVKLPRNHLPEGKGIMNAWAKLASRAACINAIAIWLITVLLVFLISQKTRAELFIQ